jgi:hypothetical protein
VVDFGPVFLWHFANQTGVSIVCTCARKTFLAYQTGVSVSFTHAGNFIWHGGFQMSRVLYNGTIKTTSFYRYE